MANVLRHLGIQSTQQSPMSPFNNGQRVQRILARTTLVEGLSRKCCTTVSEVVHDLVK